jgi:hypothetical protein
MKNPQQSRQKNENKHEKWRGSKTRCLGFPKAH